jgi:hypothetical protein
MGTNPLPAALFESLLLRLAAVLELTQKPEGTVTPQAKQAVLYAVSYSCRSTLQGANQLCTDKRVQKRAEPGKGTGPKSSWWRAAYRRTAGCPGNVNRAPGSQAVCGRNN